METHIVPQEMYEELIAPAGKNMTREEVTTIMREERKSYILMLTKARDRIAQPGKWFKGDFGPDPYIWAEESGDKPIEEAPYCALGTLNWAAGGYAHKFNGLAYDVALLIARAYFAEEDTECIANFNDSPETEQDDVVEMFDFVIAALQNKVLQD